MCTDTHVGPRCEIPVTRCTRNTTLPCSNGGTCVSILGFSRCQCAPGYAGRLCENVAAISCVSGSCLPHGTCVESHGLWRCRCSYGYSGVRCERQVDECRSSPCRHGATCVDLLDAYFCACPPGLTGVHCQWLTNPPVIVPHLCQPNPCRNGGVCSLNQTLIPAFQCTCPAGFSGLRCEFALQCPVCQFGGVCRTVGAGVQCVCLAGFTGVDCSTPIGPALRGCMSQPCLNFGTCMPVGVSYRCACSPFFQGVICAESRDPCHGNPCGPGRSCLVDPHNLFVGFRCTTFSVKASRSTTRIAVMGMVISLGLMLAGLSLVICCERQKSADKFTQKEYHYRPLPTNEERIVPEAWQPLHYPPADDHSLSTPLGHSSPLKTPDIDRQLRSLFSYDVIENEVIENDDGKNESQNPPEESTPAMADEKIQNCEDKQERPCIRYTPVVRYTPTYVPNTPCVQYTPCIEYIATEVCPPSPVDWKAMFSSSRKTDVDAEEPRPLTPLLLPHKALEERVHALSEKEPEVEDDAGLRSPKIVIDEVMECVEIDEPSRGLTLGDLNVPHDDDEKVDRFLSQTSPTHSHPHITLTDTSADEISTEHAMDSVLQVSELTTQTQYSEPDSTVRSGLSIQQKRLETEKSFSHDETSSYPETMSKSFYDGTEVELSSDTPSLSFGKSLRSRLEQEVRSAAMKSLDSLSKTLASSSHLEEVHSGARKSSDSASKTFGSSSHHAGTTEIDLTDTASISAGTSFRTEHEEHEKDLVCQIPSFRGKSAASFRIVTSQEELVPREFSSLPLSVMRGKDSIEQMEKPKPKSLSLPERGKDGGSLEPGRSKTEEKVETAQVLAPSHLIKPVAAQTRQILEKVVRKSHSFLSQNYVSTLDKISEKSVDPHDQTKDGEHGQSITVVVDDYSPPAPQLVDDASPLTDQLLLPQDAIIPEFEPNLEDGDRVPLPVVDAVTANFEPMQPNLEDADRTSVLSLEVTPQSHAELSSAPRSPDILSRDLSNRSLDEGLQEHLTSDVPEKEDLATIVASLQTLVGDQQSPTAPKRRKILTLLDVMKRRLVPCVAPKTIGSLEASRVTSDEEMVQGRSPSVTSPLLQSVSTVDETTRADDVSQKTEDAILNDTDILEKVSDSNHAEIVSLKNVESELSLIKEEDGTAPILEQRRSSTPMVNPLANVTQYQTHPVVGHINPATSPSVHQVTRPVVGALSPTDSRTISPDDDGGQKIRPRNRVGIPADFKTISPIASPGKTASPTVSKTHGPNVENAVVSDTDFPPVNEAISPAVDESISPPPLQPHRTQAQMSFPHLGSMVGHLVHWQNRGKRRLESRLRQEVVDEAVARWRTTAPPTQTTSATSKPRRRKKRKNVTFAQSAEEILSGSSESDVTGSSSWSESTSPVDEMAADRNTK